MNWSVSSHILLLRRWTIGGVVNKPFTHTFNRTKSFNPDDNSAITFVALYIRCYDRVSKRMLNLQFSWLLWFYPQALIFQTYFRTATFWSKPQKNGPLRYHYFNISNKLFLSLEIIISFYCPNTFTQIMSHAFKLTKWCCKLDSFCELDSLRGGYDRTWT